MAWFRRWQAQLTWQKVSDFANILIALGFIVMFGGLLAWSGLVWLGGGSVILGLVVLAWSDRLLPDYDEGKEE